MHGEGSAGRVPAIVPAPARGNASVRVPVEGNRRLAGLVAAINADARVRAWWHLCAVNSQRGAINDHSHTHVEAVTLHSLTLLRLLHARGVTPDVVLAHDLAQEDAEVV